MFQPELSGARRLLFLGAHSDDIEIGCGGTILTLVQKNPGLNVRWVVLSAEGKRRAEARAAARAFLHGTRRFQVTIKSFRTSYFPSQFAQIKNWIETLKAFRPEVVFTHFGNDRHQDHRIVSELTWNTFRNHLILEYEIPKYDGDLGRPNLYVPMTTKISQQKIAALTGIFKTQREKHWFDRETFQGLMRLRGVECAARYAEAFYSRKLVCR